MELLGLNLVEIPPRDAVLIDAMDELNNENIFYLKF